MKGISEVLRRCLQEQGVRTVFKSDTTLRSHLVRPKDALELTKQELGYLRSKSTTADQPQSGPVGEQHLLVGIIMRIEMHQ